MKRERVFIDDVVRALRKASKSRANMAKGYESMARRATVSAIAWRAQAAAEHFAVALAFSGMADALETGDLVLGKRGGR